MREPRRKLIHAASAIVPIGVWFLPRASALLILGVIVLIALAVEVARRESRWARYHFLVRTRGLLRQRERDRLSGATYMAIGYFFATLIFPRQIAVAAMMYNAFGDAAAAVVGQSWGRHRASWGKSLEGFATCFAVNFAVGLTIPGIGTTAALLGAVGSSLLEFLPIPVNDNLTIPIGGGLILWLASGAWGVA